MNWIQEKTRLSPAAVNACLREGEQFGIAKEVTGRKRNRLYSYVEYIRIMSEGTELPVKIWRQHARAYPYMCGHGTIGLISAAVKLGMVKRMEPTTTVLLDTPDRVVKGWATVRNGQVIDVEIENVPAFLYQKDLQVNVDVGRGAARFRLPVKSPALSLL